MHGARESWDSIHCHSHRHGLHCNDLGGGKPSMTAQREQWWMHSDEDITMSRGRGIYYVIHTNSALVARLCPAGQCILIVLFILLCMFKLYFLNMFLYTCRIYGFWPLFWTLPVDLDLAVWLLVLFIIIVAEYTEFSQTAANSGWGTRFNLS